MDDLSQNTKQKHTINLQCQTTFMTKKKKIGKDAAYISWFDTS